VATTSSEYSRLGFGGAAIGISNYMGVYDAAGAATRQTSVEAVLASVDVGINYLDTAPGYGSGLSETIFGEALQKISKPYFLATKAPLSQIGKVRASLEASLKRLNVSRVDLLQIHGTSYLEEDMGRIFANGGMLSEMQRLQSEGLIGEIGFTTEDNNAATYALIKSGAFSSMQIAYNLLLQHPYEPTRPFGSLFEAKKQKMRIVTMRTATSGIFQRWVQIVNPDNTFDYTRALIQFVLSNKLVDVALVGIRTPEMARSCGDIMRDEAGRVDIDALWNRFVEEGKFQ
jgi:aryl-alcohol dehydrogenase-like predicted oxidoreductase